MLSIERNKQKLITWYNIATTRVVSPYVKYSNEAYLISHDCDMMLTRIILEVIEDTVRDLDNCPSIK